MVPSAVSLRFPGPNRPSIRPEDERRLWCRRFCSARLNARVLDWRDEQQHTEAANKVRPLAGEGAATKSIVG